MGMRGTGALGGLWGRQSAVRAWGRGIARWTRPVSQEGTQALVTGAGAIAGGGTKHSHLARQGPADSAPWTGQGATAGPEA